ncbi:MAG: type transport system permease protein [Frankiaceae bacterium]|nr:type transport system permease protein [Frankiaceae bacterium]
MTAPAVPTIAPLSRSKLAWAVSDGVAMTKRTLIAYTRIPEALFFTLVQPLMFVLLFRYVFGGAIHPGGGLQYVDILIPGIFVQTLVFGAVGTAIGLSEDLHKGVIDRFRALPMARSAVLAGRTTGDLVKNVPVAIVIFLMGLLVGFRPHGSIVNIVLATLLLLFFSYAISWGFAIIGLTAPNSETAQLMSFPLLFPLTFASGAFAPTETMPSWLRGFADHQPVGALVHSTRSLMLGQPVGSYVWESLAWSVALLAIFSTIAVRSYRKIA